MGHPNADRGHPGWRAIPLGHHDISSARGQLWRTDGAIRLHIDRIIASSALLASGLITVRGHFGRGTKHIHWNHRVSGRLKSRRAG
jgi:hypothetical protein